jgi:hypothetical protein
MEFVLSLFLLVFSADFQKIVLTQKIKNLFETDMENLYRITEDDLQKVRYNFVDEGNDWLRLSIRTVNEIGETEGFTILEESEPKTET